MYIVKIIPKNCHTRLTRIQLCRPPNCSLIVFVHGLGFASILVLIVSPAGRLRAVLRATDQVSRARFGRYRLLLLTRDTDKSFRSSYHYTRFNILQINNHGQSYYLTRDDSLTVWRGVIATGYLRMNSRRRFDSPG